jgi:hypothetical protein
MRGSTLANANVFRASLLNADICGSASVHHKLVEELGSVLANPSSALVLAKLRSRTK